MFILWLVLLSMAMALVVLAVIFGIKNPRPDFMNKQGHYVPTEHCMLIFTWLSWPIIERLTDDENRCW